MSQGRTSDSAIGGIRVTPEILKRLADAHDRFMRGARLGRRAVLRHCDLSGLDLSNLDFTSAELIGCDFSGADLQKSTFRHANIVGARFHKANLAGSNMARADLRAARFDRADLTGAVLDGADLRRGALVTEGLMPTSDTNHSSTFRSALLRGTRLIQSRLKNADFTHAVLRGANLSGADLRESIFHGAELQDIQMQSAMLGDADFRGALFDERSKTTIDFSRSVIENLHRPTEAELRAQLEGHFQWIQTGGDEGARASLAGFDLTDVDLSGLILAAADFEFAVMARANLKRTLLAAANLRHTNLLQANLSGADLRGGRSVGRQSPRRQGHGRQAGDVARHQPVDPRTLIAPESNVKRSRHRKERRFCGQTQHAPVPGQLRKAASQRTIAVATDQ